MATPLQTLGRRLFQFGQISIDRGELFIGNLALRETLCALQREAGAKVMRPSVEILGMCRSIIARARESSSSVPMVVLAEL